MRTLLLAFSLVTALVLGSQSSLATEPAGGALSPYRAVYSAVYNGMDVKAVRELKIRENSYSVSSEIEGMLGSVSEREDFHLGPQDGIQPDRYRIRKSFIGIDQEEKFDVDPVSRRGVFIRKDKRRELALKPEHLGPVSYQVQMRRDLEAATAAAAATGLKGKTFSYPVFSRGKIRDYQFEILGSEETATGVGRIPTLKLQRVREDGQRKTLFWVAPAWNFLIVKIQQQEDGEQYEMVLEQASINHRAVAPTEPH